MFCLFALLLYPWVIVFIHKLALAALLGWQNSAKNADLANFLRCGSSWTHARSVLLGRVILPGIIAICSSGIETFLRRKFRFRDAAAGNCS